jgi:wobble nucleotide-excising tRNase
MKTLEESISLRLVSELRKRTPNPFSVQKWKSEATGDWWICIISQQDKTRYAASKFCGLKEIAEQVEKELKNENIHPQRNSIS